MAHAVTSAPILRLARSAQSGTKAMAATYAVVYTESSITAIAYLFAGAEIDLSTMAAGDTIDLRIRKQVVSGGGWVVHDEKTGSSAYTGARPATHPSVHINPIPDVFGVEISMRQTAGVLRSIPCEFYDAKRLGVP